LVFDIADNHDCGGWAHWTKIFTRPAPCATFFIDRYVLTAAPFLYEIYDSNWTIPRAG
jgi:hypothetical protein